MEHRVTIPLDDEDWDLLLRLAAHEKLPKAEILRRGLRSYQPVQRPTLQIEPKNAANG
jgi:hypothetical protein